jgi:phenylpyruvate tautomerase PptA (4-oxalocrotonate tautomerase family)
VGYFRGLDEAKGEVAGGLADKIVALVMIRTVEEWPLVKKGSITWVLISQVARDNWGGWTGYGPLVR